MIKSEPRAPVDFFQLLPFLPPKFFSTLLPAFILGIGMMSFSCTASLPPASTDPLPIPFSQSEESITPAADEVLGYSETSSLSDPSFSPIPVLKSDPLKIVIDPKVNRFIEYFQTEQRERFSRWLERSRRYLPIMEQILRSEGIPSELAHMALIESGFNTHARSRARAVGPWQFMRYTGKKYGLRIDEWVDERRDPIKSTYAAARYLKDLYRLFGCWHLAAAGYNAGEGKVSRALRKSGVDDFWELVRYPYLKRETKNYVPKLMAAILISHEPEEYGFEQIEYLPPLDFEVVTTHFPIHLDKVAKFLGLPPAELLALNPELRYPFTPPDCESYDLRVPVGSGLRVKEFIDSLPASERLNLVHHRVRSGETLSGIARKYRTRVSAIKEMNRISNSHRLRAGSTILIPIPASSGKGKRS